MSWCNCKNNSISCRKFLVYHGLPQEVANKITPWGTVSDEKENEKFKLTKVLEFVPARKPEQAKIGEVIRFMHNPGNGLSAYWMQGEIQKRIDKYTVAKDSGFTRNRFEVKKLSVINHWGDLT